MRLAALLILALITGCQAPLAQLTFPYRPLRLSDQPQWFDVDRDGRNDFAFTFKANRLDALQYDDDEDGTPDRIYHLREYASEGVPHLIILLDSVPFQSLADRYARGEFRWFAPPAKIIPPFPSMTEVCYTEVLHATPMAGMIDQFYDRRRGEIHSGMSDRFFGGYQYPWERYLHYRSHYREEGLAYLNPRPWYHAELERARAALDQSPDRTSIVYLTSASGMACKYGQQGIDEVLDGAARLCLQLLYERRGALRISLMADHGHNLAPSKNIRVDELLRKSGFHIAKRLDQPNDVVLELNGLVTYAAARTTQPKKVAAALLKHPGINLAMHMQGEAIVLRDAEGFATIRSNNGLLQYHPSPRDVLGYADVVKNINLDPDGFASRDDWFAATVDHEYPDAPARVWDAFHRLVIDPPDVMFTTRNGYCAGVASYERFITMKSTHGSLDQINSATFVMTTHGSPLKPMRSRDVMKAIEPSYVPRVVPR